MHDEVAVACPYCGESIDLVIDPSTTGSFVQDCDVCCNPWAVTVERDADGDPFVTVERAQ
ncbi:MAG: CPXCG motif-containing cysteine-rich protein [bacterium]